MAQLDDDLHYAGSLLVRELAILLKLSLTTRSLAHIYFHSFYSGGSSDRTESFLRHPILDVAMAAIFLASKVNEETRRVRDVVNAGYYLFHVVRGVDFVPWPYVCDAYYAWRQRVTDSEMHLLHALKFRTHRPLPYGFFISYLKALDLMSERSFSQTALEYLNDAFMSASLAQSSPFALACVAIDMSCHRSRLQLPVNWHAIFDVTTETLTELEREFKCLLRMPDGRRLLQDLPITPRELAVFAEEFRAETEYQQSKRRKHC